MKRLLFIVVISSISFAVYAQPAGGIKAGVSFSSFGGDQPDIRQNMKYRTGFHFGGYFNIAISEKFSFQPECLFSTAGAKWMELYVLENSETMKLDVNETLSYLCIPLSIVYSIGRFNLHTGPQVSFLLEADDEVAISRIVNGNLVTVSGVGRRVELRKEPTWASILEWV